MTETKAVRFPVGGNPEIVSINQDDVVAVQRLVDTDGGDFSIINLGMLTVLVAQISEPLPVNVDATHAFWGYGGREVLQGTVVFAGHVKGEFIMDIPGIFLRECGLE